MSNMAGAAPVVVPPVLYLPVLEGPDESQRAVVRELADGRLGLLAYTALDRLADKCGADQPWVLVSLSELGLIKEQQPFDVVAFDIQVPLEQRPNGRIA